MEEFKDDSGHADGTARREHSGRVNVELEEDLGELLGLEVEAQLLVSNCFVGALDEGDDPVLLSVSNSEVGEDKLEGVDVGEEGAVGLVRVGNALLELGSPPLVQVVPRARVVALRPTVPQLYQLDFLSVYHDLVAPNHRVVVAYHQAVLVVLGRVSSLRSRRDYVALCHALHYYLEDQP